MASMVPMKFLLLGLAALRTQSSQVQAFATTTHFANSIVSGKKMSSSALDMARTRGLERREEGATPLGEFISYYN